MDRLEPLEKLRELKPWLESQGVVDLRLFGSFARDVRTVAICNEDRVARPHPCLNLTGVISTLWLRRWSASRSIS